MILAHGKNIFSKLSPLKGRQLCWHGGGENLNPSPAGHQIQMRCSFSRKNRASNREEIIELRCDTPVINNSITKFDI